MWYQKSRPQPVTQPTKRQQWTLRTIILAGLAGLVFFLYKMANPLFIMEPFLYYLLYGSFVVLALKVCFEWYHYFSASVPVTPPLERNFTVDVFTTYCAGEPKDMIRNTLKAIQAIEYPHTTYLCDEADDPELKEFCASIGVEHVTRTQKINAKAGNINNALRTRATGEICLILDPDHVPVPDFFDHILPHFQNEEIGFVQVVQAYKNLHENIIAKGSAQQTFQFYGPIMMGMHSYGTAQAIGANCTFRRKALDSIGGHAAGLAEDLNTSMHLHAKGWKSVYVPRVLNRGLVPNTISSYFKQQLKWSRGVMELIWTTYLKNFWNFTWRQKIYYGLTPLHYLFGFVYAINFFIPIYSLFKGTLPMNISLATFLLYGMPFFMSALLARMYVQRWVMEEDERGFHMVGGLLTIGTWWIHSLGVIYTFLRRKIPYLPTPKDGNESAILIYNLPNLVIALISVVAIGYGLYTDYNPYSAIMAGFALLNMGILGVVFLASYQNRFRQFRKQNPGVHHVMEYYRRTKRLLWLARHQLYGGIRVLALPIFIGSLAALFYFGTGEDLEDIEATPITKPTSAQYLGAYLPQESKSYSSLAALESLEAKAQFKTKLVSTYLPWSVAGAETFNSAYFKRVFSQGRFPLITWEPWLPPADSTKEDQPIFKRIVQGETDAYLHQMSQRFKNLEKPIFLRFAHEPDNPQYPWGIKHDSAAAYFKQAWRYVHAFMKKQEVDNLIWVYNPWRWQAADPYFPGEAYVDWLSITALNYGAAVDADNWQNPRELLKPFFRQLSFQKNLPVMLAETGTLSGSGDTESWFTALREVLNDYPQIKAVVFFGAKADANVLASSGETAYNWQAQWANLSLFSTWQQNLSAPEPSLFTRSKTPLPKLAHWRQTYAFTGVNYKKAQDWQASMHPLFKKTVDQDFSQIKNLGLQVIKRYGPGVYDNNVLTSAAEQGIKVIYSFWVPGDFDFLKDTLALEELTTDIAADVKSLKGDEPIMAWHLGNALWHSLASRYTKPQLMAQRRAYLRWLNATVQAIKAVDSVRPISAEVLYDPYLVSLAELYRKEVPYLTALGVNLNEKDQLDSLQKWNRQVPLVLFANKLEALPENFETVPTGWLAKGWQDDVFSNYVSFDGLLNHRGYKKPEYRALEVWQGQQVPGAAKDLRIVPPAEPPFAGMKLWYQALVKEQNRWHLAEEGNTQESNYYWQLVKVDKFGNPLAMQELGSGAKLKLTIPPHAHQYQLVLNWVEEGYTRSVRSNITTPLYYGPNLQPLSPAQADYFFKQSKKTPSETPR